MRYLQGFSKKKYLTHGIALGICALGVAVIFGALSDVDAYRYKRSDATPNAVPAPVLLPSTPTVQQKYVVFGSVISKANPGVYLTQKDDGTWQASSYREENTQVIQNIPNSVDGTPYPAKAIIFNKIDFKDDVYKPTSEFILNDGSSTKKSWSSMVNRDIALVEDTGNSGTKYTMLFYGKDPSDDLDLNLYDMDTPTSFKKPGDVLRYPSFKDPYFEFRVEVGGDPKNGGYSILPGSYSYEDKPDGFGSWVRKYKIGYEVTLNLEWRAQYDTEKIIRLNAPSSLLLGEVQTATATVSTLEGNAATWGANIDVSQAAQTTFSLLSGSDVVSLSGAKNNIIKAEKNGVATLQVDWVNPITYKDSNGVAQNVLDKDGKPLKWHLRSTKTIYVGYDGGSGGGDPNPPECTVPAKVQEMLSPTDGLVSGVSGVLRADDRGAERFNVGQGIPTSESLYANIISKKYLYDYRFERYTGTCTWEIKVNKTWIHNWSVYETVGYTEVKHLPGGGTTGGDPIKDWVSYGPESDPKSKKYTVTRPYSFWKVGKFDTYKISKATLANYALSGGQTTLNPSNYSLPVITAANLDPNMDIPEVETEITLDSENVPNEGTNGKQTAPDEDWTQDAEDAVGKVKVRNDSVTYNGSPVMESEWHDESTPAPVDLTPPSMTENYVLYSTGLIIPSGKQNQSNNPTTGNIEYERWVSLASPSNIVQQINGVNSVSIHTPVVNYSTMSDDNAVFDQSVVQDRSKITLILGRDETISFSSSGQHLNYTGYGNRDYSKYMKEKRIRFPFDVYWNGTFYSKNSWISLGVGTNSFSVKIPEWVTEGSYVVRTESWAENALAYTNSQKNANTNTANYGAFEEFVVKVVGRVYGLRIYDIGDLRYETVFRERKGSTTWSGFQYYSGTNDLNGVALGESVTADKALPIRQGTHPTQAATVPHNGYPILFYFNTIGNVWNVGEGVKITPSFYFVPKKGGVDPVEVDLYYNGTKNKLVKVGSSLDRSLFKRTVMMGDPLRSVSSEYLTYMGTYEYNNFWTAAAKSNKTLEKFLLALPTRKTDIGQGYQEIILNYQMRTLVGKVDTGISVSGDEQRRSVQRWFGEYNLPIAPYIVAKGTNLEEKVRTQYGGSVSGKESIFLKDGYIIVRFNISTYMGSAPNTPVLKYDASANGGANMWKIEKQITSSTTYLGSRFDFGYGDVAMFESDFSVRDDYKGTGF